MVYVHALSRTILDEIGYTPEIRPWGIAPVKLEPVEGEDGTWLVSHGWPPVVADWLQAYGGALVTVTNTPPPGWRARRKGGEGA